MDPFDAEGFRKRTNYSLNLPDWRVTWVNDKPLSYALRTDAIFARVVGAEYEGLLICKGQEKRHQAGKGCGQVFRVEDLPKKNVQRAPAMHFNDLPVGMLPVRIEVERPIVKCPHCRYRFRPQLGGLESDHWMTTRLRAYIEDRFFQPYATVDAIALECGVAVRTVKTITDSIAERRLAGRVVESPITLGLDNKQVRNGMRTVLVALGIDSPTKLDGSFLLNLLPSYNKAAVIRGLKGLPKKERIQNVAMDATPFLRVAVREVLGRNVKIILDRFHFQKLLNVPYESGQVARCKKSLIAIFNNEEIDKEKAADLIDDWVASLSEELRKTFKRFLGVWAEWREEILNYFENRITNAGTEQRNGIIQKYISIGKASSLDFIMAKVVFHGSYLRDGRAPQWGSCRKCGAISNHADHVLRMVGGEYDELGREVTECCYRHLVRLDGTQVPIKFLYECNHHPVRTSPKNKESGKKTWRCRSGLIEPVLPPQSEEEMERAYETFAA